VKSPLARLHAAQLRGRGLRAPGTPGLGVRGLAVRARGVGGLAVRGPRVRVRAMPAPHLPRRTIRLRLTAVYAILFLVSGAGLLAITYVLVEDHFAPPILTSKNELAIPTSRSAAGGSVIVGQEVGGPGILVPVGRRPVVVPTLGESPGAGSAIFFKSPAGPVGSTFCSAGGAGLVQGPTTSPDLDQLSRCVDNLHSHVVRLEAQAASSRNDYLNTLLIDSGFGLAAMTLVALGLGWLVSGRVLSPLRTITRTAKNISASNLHERLALDGPDDELKELGDTVDGLLARLEGSFAAQRQFVANASHELRTPLARQRTLVEVALADPDRTVDSLAAACQRVLAAGQQQERLIEGLLTLARSQRGLDQFEPVDLAALTRETVLSRSPDAHQRDIKIAVVASPAVFPGDARLAERLITNLLDNAIRHNHAGGTVTVRTTAATGQAVLSVANSGPVIHPAEVPGLFEPFRHRGTTRTSDGDSPGLGLSIVGAIAAAHGASVWVWAPPEGGLDIQVRFPTKPGVPTAAAESPDRSSAMPGAPAGVGPEDYAAPGPADHAAPGLDDRGEPVITTPAVPGVRVG
jgi:signal transduction histidine kinase